MNYIKITQFDTANGPGIRTVLWVAGCSHSCYGCHNKNTWDYNGGMKYDGKAVDIILKSLSSKYISGLTLSGGDPLYLYNRKEIDYLVKLVKIMYPEKSIWLYTGYTYEELQDLIMKENNPSHIESILNNIDVLVDGKFILEKKDMTLPYCGSTNQRVIDMKKTLASKKGKVILYEG